MRRLSLFTVLGILAVGAATSAAAPKPHEAWATGQIERFDGAANSVVVKQGTHEMTFVLAPHVSVIQGKKTLQPRDLTGDVGHQAKIRYTTNAGTKLADRIEVSDVAPAHSEKVPVTK